MRAWGGRALLVLGAASLAAGLANVVLPGAVFPSSVTCVTDWDTILCAIEPWAAGPWLALLGALIVVVAVIVLHGRRPIPGRGADATR